MCPVRYMFLFLLRPRNNDFFFFNEISSWLWWRNFWEIACHRSDSNCFFLLYSPGYCEFSGSRPQAKFRLFDLLCHPGSDSFLWTLVTVSFNLLLAYPISDPMIRLSSHIYLYSLLLACGLVSDLTGSSWTLIVPVSEKMSWWLIPMPCKIVNFPDFLVFPVLNSRPLFLMHCYHHTQP